MPNENYKYTAYAELNGQRSPQISAEIVTMDTTSHNFSWATYEFGGQGGSSAFYDVAIIDENDIWAVGEIYTKDTYTYDSLGNWIDPYNAAHWDGEKWDLKRIFINNTFYPLRKIITFNNSDIWFANISLIHWNGKNFSFFTSPPHDNTGNGWAINGIWGSSSEDLFVVGNRGNIAHYDGHSWTKIVSGTDLPIQDIYGSKDERTGEYEILCVASNIGYDYGKKLLKIEGNSAREINSKGLSWSLRGLWFKTKRKYIIVGDGYYESADYNHKWKRTLGLPRKYKFSIDAISFNDIITCGSYGLLSHYNGYSWRHFDTAVENNSIKIKDNLSVIAAEDGRKAYLIIGKR